MNAGERVLLGAHVGWNETQDGTVLTRWEEWARAQGKTPAVYSDWVSPRFEQVDTIRNWDGDDVFALADATGSALHLTWELWPAQETFSPVLRGGALAGPGKHTVDEWAIMLADHILRYEKTVYLRVLHEPNAAGYPWCAYDHDGSPRLHTAADLRKLFCRIVLIFRGGAIPDINAQLVAMDAPPLAFDAEKLSRLGFRTFVNGTLLATNNVSWQWSPLPINQPSVPGNHWENYYPGDEWVDWIGCDPYAALNKTGENRVMDGVNDIHGFAQKHGKPMAFPEWGMRPNGLDDSAFVRRIGRWMKSHPRLGFVSNFEMVHDPEGDYRMRLRPQAMTAWREIVSDSRFVGRD